MYLTQALHRSLLHSPQEVMTVAAGRARTVEEVADRVARLAAGLKSLGAGTDRCVAMLALNSDRYHEYLLAVPWADGIVNPVNTRWSVAEIAFSLDHCDTRVILVDEAHAGLVPELRARCAGLQAIVHCGEGEPPQGCLSYEELIAGSAPVEDARRGADKVAGIFYTGGTDGLPKGVALSHRNLLAQSYGLLATRSFLRPGGRFLHAAPIFHLADLCGWLGQLVLGGTQVFLPGFDPVSALSAIETHGVTDTILVPAMVRMMIDHPRFDDYDRSSLAAVLCGSAPLSVELIGQARRAFPGTDFMQGYGMTETAAAATLLSPRDYAAHPHVLPSAGRALPHNEVQIVDRQGNELPHGHVGEIVIRGDNVMLGYWNDAEATARALREGWMHTGDGGYMDERGFLFIVDRVKDMVITGGENVYCAEVENALRTHPGIEACAVIGVPDAEWGERVHAVIVAKAGVGLAPEEVRDHAKRLIAGYKSPRSVEFVDSLPMSEDGIVSKSALRAKYWQGVERQVN